MQDCFFNASLIFAQQLTLGTIKIWMENRLLGRERTKLPASVEFSHADLIFWVFGV